jgi:hypothetical protein
MSRDRTPEPGHGIDDPDLEDPLTADDIVNHAGRSGDLPDRRAGGDSQATRLVALASGHFRLLRGEDGRAYATAHDGPAVAFGLRGRDGLRTRLARLYYASFGQTPGGAALTDALTVLQGQAEMADPEPVALRVAAVGGQAVALDLGRADGRCVLMSSGAMSSSASSLGVAAPARRSRQSSSHRRHGWHPSTAVCTRRMSSSSRSSSAGRAQRGSAASPDVVIGVPPCRCDRPDAT